ncbi:hypothetical protein QQF64_032536 [Cirrhinus molitorella]|uniref:Uncharacterized protein n=1 Tax=Cirrhinus molitorella TaxID=172907 RepID=A0ABR3N029_9TELE
MNIVNVLASWASMSGMQHHCHLTVRSRLGDDRHDKKEEERERKPGNGVVKDSSLNVMDGNDSAYCCPNEHAELRQHRAARLVSRSAPLLNLLWVVGSISMLRAPCKTSCPEVTSKWERFEKRSLGHGEGRRH